MVGTVSVWRQRVAGVIVTAMVLMPGLAIRCAAACLRSTPATAASAAGAAAHAHHGSTPAQDEIRVDAEVGVAPVHDCRDHDGADHWWRTVSRLAAGDRQVVSTSESTHPFPLAVGALLARYARSTHGPPGASGVVTPIVLRI